MRTTTRTTMAKLSFEDWKAQVNAEVVRLTTMDADDIMDYDYYQAWAAGDRPKQTAAAAVAAAAAECGIDEDAFEEPERWDGQG